MRSGPMWKSSVHAERDRENLRDVERKLDLLLRRDPPTIGRIWCEYNKGIHEQCHACGRRGRCWIGTYFVYSVAPHVVPYSIHRSDPLCAFHAIEQQRVDMTAGRPHWRAAPLQPVGSL